MTLCLNKTCNKPISFLTKNGLPRTFCNQSCYRAHRKRNT